MYTIIYCQYIAHWVVILHKLHVRPQCWLEYFFVRKSAGVTIRTIFLMIIFYWQKHAYNCLAYHMFSAYRLLIYCYFIYSHAITFVLQEVSNNLIKTKIGNVAHIFTSIKSDLTDLLSK